MKSYCIKVKKEDTQKTLRKFSFLLNKNLKFKKEKEFILIPIVKRIKNSIIDDFQELKPRINDYKQLLPNLKNLPTSYDIIGDIIVIKLYKELIKFKKEIANALLEKHKNARIVALDKGIKGDFRVRNLEIIGEVKNSKSKNKKLQTIHKEYDINLKMNLKKTYFSPRLSTEHYRVCSLVKNGETIIDMFCGIGSFAIMIAKYKNAKVYAIDINKNAIKYLKENIKINKVKNIFPILGDAAVVMKNLEKANRIIMNLPFSAKDFFGIALNSLKEKGIIHYYTIINREKIEQRIEELKMIAKKNKRKLKLLNLKKVRGYSSLQDNFVMDLEVK